MKTLKILAAVALVATPLVSQANSLAEQQAFQANHQPLNTGDALQARQSNGGQLNTAASLAIEGKSAAAGQALERVALSTRHTTQLPHAELDTPRVGHEVSW